MLKISLAMFCAFIGLVARADDIPEGMLVANQVTNISIYELVSAVMTNDTSRIVDFDGERFAQVAATLELNVVAEGNICGANPADVFTNVSEVARNDYQLKLGYMFQTNPYSRFPTGCQLYSAPRNIKVALQVIGNSYTDAPLNRTFSLQIGRWGEEVVATVSIQYVVGGGFTVTIER